MRLMSVAAAFAHPGMRLTAKLLTGAFVAAACVALNRAIVAGAVF
jgi:hypothetical protein